MQIANLLASFRLARRTSFAAPWVKRRRKKWPRNAPSSWLGAPPQNPREKAERIFNLMEEFAGYGFNNRIPAPTRCLLIRLLLENALSR